MVYFPFLWCNSSIKYYQQAFVVAQSLSHVLLFVTPWTTTCQVSLSFSISQSWLKLMFFKSMMPSNHLILCHHLLLLPSILPSIRVFSNESALPIRWPKFWSFSFSISPSNDSSGLISFRIDWFDLLAIQRTLNSLLQHHSLKAQILWCSAFFKVQFSHPYLTTGKTIALTRWTIFNMVSRFVNRYSLFFTVLWPPGEDSVPMPDKMEQGIAMFPSFWPDWDICKNFWPHQSLAAKTQGSAPDSLRPVLGKYSGKSGKWGDVAFQFPFQTR